MKRVSLGIPYFLENFKIMQALKVLVGALYHITLGRGPPEWGLMESKSPGEYPEEKGFDEEEEDDYDEHRH